MHEPSRPLGPLPSARPDFDAEDLAATTPVHDDYAVANLADTVPTALATAAEARTLISTPTPVSASVPASASASVPAQVPGQAPGPVTRSETGSFSQTGSSSTSSSYTRFGTRLGRTRINHHLQLTDQQLDERLQLSRSSVLTDMTAARGAQAVPKGLQKLVTDQGTDARYHINRPLAAGGMGAVLDIQDNDFRRGAAMKVMHGRFTNDPQALERFLAEAQVTAQLEHPNIVPIHDMGVMPDGSLYFTMKLIEGLSLGDVVKLQRIHAGLLTRDDYLADKVKKEATKTPDARRSHEQLAAEYDADVSKGVEIAARFTPEATLLMFLKILDGVGFAHSRGVVHRDIKPDNIMLGAHGEVLVVDWGIAKVLKKADRECEFVRKIEREVVSVRDEQAISATVSGSAMGTLFYMPPEQACGELERLDGRSDIYALGATLYELLALRRCFEAKSLAEALAIITTGDWVPLDRVLPTLSKDLVAIVHRAMALDPGRRYGDCGQFADDIRRYLAGQAVLARQRNVIELVGAWVAAHKRQVQVGAGGLVLIVATIAGTTSYLHHATVQAGNAKLGEAQARYAAAQKSDALEGYQEAKQILATASGFIANDGRISELREAINQSIKDAQRRQDEERKRQAAQISAKLSYDEALKLSAEERYEDAESNINAALRIDPLNADFLKTRDEIRRLLNDRRLRQRAQQARELRAQADAALVTADQLTRDNERVVVLLEAAKTAFDQLESLPPVAGTQEQIQRYTTLRVSAEQARSHKRLAAEAVPLKKAAREALTAERYEAARAALEQARGKTPEDQDLVLLNDELVSAETRYHDQQALLKARKDADQALEMARGFEKSGKLDEALARIDVALTFVSNDGKALALREQVLLKKRQAEQEERRMAAIAVAETAMTEANREQKISAEAYQQATAATVRIVELDRQLGRAPIAQKSPLFSAIAEQKAARTAMAEHWALAEGKANSALAALAEFPAEAKAGEVRKLLCQLYLNRLKEARKTRSLSEINAFSNLIRRFDPDGSFKRELDNRGQLTVTGSPSAAVVARVLEEGPDTRLVPFGDPLPVTPGAAVSLPVGSYLVTSGAQSMTVVISAGQNRTLAWPGALPAIPGVPLSYVPAHGEQQPFLLGTTEVTVAQYLEFLRSPGIFASIVKRYRESYESGKPLPFPHMPAAMIGDDAFVPLYFALGHVPADESQLGTISLLPGIDAKLPMGKVTRPDAEAYCTWLSQSAKLKVRLPKLKEWQFAAQGGDDRRVYPWGPYFVGQFAATALSSDRKSAEQNQQAVKVGSFPADCGPFGHLDLAGNVREWLGDNDQDGPLAAGASGALIAGGSYSSDNPLIFTTSFSESVEPDSAYVPIGFRILVELP